MTFAPADVWKVARALLANAINWDRERGRNAYNECAHCSAWVYHNEDADKIEHKPECPVLAARDLLTGAPPDEA